MLNWLKSLFGHKLIISKVVVSNNGARVLFEVGKSVKKIERVGNGSIITTDYYGFMTAYKKENVILILYENRWKR